MKIVEWKEQTGLRTLYCIFIQGWTSAEVTTLETVISNVDTEGAECGSLVLSMIVGVCWSWEDNLKYISSFAMTSVSQCVDIGFLSTCLRERHLMKRTKVGSSVLWHSCLSVHRSGPTPTTLPAPPPCPAQAPQLWCGMTSWKGEMKVCLLDREAFVLGLGLSTATKAKIFLRLKM